MSKKIVFLDENRDIVSEEKATWKVIHEYNNKGELIDEMWILLNKDIVKTEWAYDDEGYKGYWTTMDGGQHIFIREGESMDDALGRLRETKPVGYKIEGAKDKVELHIIESSLKKLPKEDLDGIKKVVIVDEADYFAIGGEKIKCDAFYNLYKGEIKVERYLLTNPELNRVMFHEVAHNRWNKLSYAQQTEWSKVYRRGRKFGYKFPSFYATSNPEEAYAECYAFYKNGKTEKVDGIFMKYLKNLIPYRRG